MDDEAYRQKLIKEGGGNPEIINAVPDHELNWIGNILGVYRTSMQEQDPARFALKTAKRSDNRKLPPLWLTLLIFGILWALGVLIVYLWNGSLT